MQAGSMHRVQAMRLKQDLAQSVVGKRYEEDVRSDRCTIAATRYRARQVLSCWSYAWLLRLDGIGLDGSCTPNRIVQRRGFERFSCCVKGEFAHCWKLETGNWNPAAGIWGRWDRESRLLMVNGGWCLVYDDG